MADARLTALRGLNEVFGQGGYSNLVLEGLMRKNELTGQERAFCTALFYGVVERRITLDWVLGRYSRQPVEKLSPAVRDILRKMTITDRLLEVNNRQLRSIGGDVLPNQVGLF